MTQNFVAHRLLIDYSLNIGYIQWLINWLLIDFLLMTHWFHWCHQLVTSGKQLSYRPNTLFVDEFLWSLAQYLRKWSSKVHFQALFSHSSGQFLMSSKFSHTNGIFLPKKQRAFHPTAKEGKINMFRSIIRCKAYFETHVKCMCKKACTGIVALRAVQDTTRLGYMMTSNKVSKWRPRRGKQRRSLPGSLLRLEVPFSLSTLRAVT